MATSMRLSVCDISHSTDNKTKLTSLCSCMLELRHAFQSKE